MSTKKIVLSSGVTIEMELVQLVRIYVKQDNNAKVPEFGVELTTNEASEIANELLIYVSTLRGE